MSTATKKKPAGKSVGKTAAASHVLHRLVPVDKIAPDPGNRDVGDIAELTASIAQHGIIQPLVVTGGPLADDYLLVAGHRRLAAAKAAGLPDVPCVVRDDLEQAARLEIRLIENVERRDLSPLEEADAYRQLVDEFGYTQTQLAKRLARSQGHISKRLALLDLPEKARDRVDAGDLPISDALELAKLDPDAQARVLSIGNAEAMRHRIDSERRRAESKAAQDDRVAELKKGGVDARRPQYGVPHAWRVLAKLDDIISEHVEAGIAGAIVYDGGVTVEFLCTDPDHDHTPPERPTGTPPGTPAAGDAAPRRADELLEQERTLGRVQDRLEAIAKTRAAAITDGLARLDLTDHTSTIAAFVAAQQLDMVASMQGGYDVIPLTPQGAERAGRYLRAPGDDGDATVELRARLLDGRVAPLWTLAALALADVEEHLATSMRWGLREMPVWASDADDEAARRRVIARHYKFLTAHLSYKLNRIEKALLAGDDLDDPAVQARLGLTGEEG